MGDEPLPLPLQNQGTRNVFSSFYEIALKLAVWPLKVISVQLRNSEKL